MLNSPIDEIKNRLDIVEIVGSYIKLHKAGANLRALCPFHSEKTPSFFVSPARQIWHCFGCQRGGNIFNFVMEIEGVEFGDALRILAQRAGVELKPMKPELRTERQRLYEICELATRFFEKQLEGISIGKEAKKYLISRGISEESIKKWRLGYSPDTWESLSNFLVSKGYKKEEIERAGLVIKSEHGSFYDRFRGRIIFPIFDLNSQVVGFSGRVFNPPPESAGEQSRLPTSEAAGFGGQAKYVNTPNTLIYDKSRILYGLDKAKVEIRRKNSCILVEGNTDVIMAQQSGLVNAVATSGTALTPFQLKILKRYSDNLLIAFDMDVAGETATKRGIDLSQTQGFNIKVVRLPEGKDPAEIIFKNPNRWEEAINSVISILDFYFVTAFENHDPKTPEGKKEISKILLPPIKRIPNKIEQAYWIQKLAEKLEVKEGDIEEELKKVKIGNLGFLTSDIQAKDKPLPKSRKEKLEERIVTLILKSPQNFNFLDKKLISYFSPQIQEILIKLGKNQSLLTGSSVSDYFNHLSLKAEVEEIEEEEILPEIQSCLIEIQSLEIKKQLDRISKDLKKAEEEKDLKKIEKLTQEFNQLAKEII